MIRQNADNYLQRFRRLFQPYCVDMYVKLETELLIFISYIHLRDTIRTRGNAAICKNMGKMEWRMFVITVGKIY